MQNRKLIKFRYLREGCTVSGVIGFLLLASIPDNIPEEMIVARAAVALLVMLLSWTTYWYSYLLENQYIRYPKHETDKTKKSAQNRQIHKQHS